MRKSKQSAAEIEQAELEDNNRKVNRKAGFSLMDIRDRGWVRLPNLAGGSVLMSWHVKTPLKELECRQVVPDNEFILNVDGKVIALDAEEFRKWLRWV